MLQVIIQDNNQYSMAELAQMAIEGGCRWIVIDGKGLNDEELKQRIAPELIEVCRENESILTIMDRPELAKELGVHGVFLTTSFLTSDPAHNAVAIRDELGPEAIIGVECPDWSGISALQSADIDYASVICQGFDNQASEYIVSARKQSASLPIVATGAISANDIRALLVAGYSGIAIEASSISAEDPVAAIEEYINAIQQA